MTNQQQPSPFGLRMPADLKDWLTAQAEAERRSVNNQIVILLERARDEAAKTDVP